MPFKDIIVAVHGIGDQSRFATVRSVTNRMANLKSLADCATCPPVAPQPLGYFHSDVQNIAGVHWLDDAGSLKGCELENTGFSEVFWADIPQDVVNEGRTLDETKAWAKTVVARAQSLCDQARKDPAKNWIVPPNFSLAGEVLEEIIETVYVLENLTLIAEKAGLFQFDLRKVLEEYLGDVQLVTEFVYHRKNVIGRFHKTMEDIHQQYPDARIHIVAHSEGTVVSFLGLLHAMNRERVHPAFPDGEEAGIEALTAPPPWINQIRGFMTIGSPLDKHILLWRRLWKDFIPERINQALPAGQIRWRNYYDYGDPVGFKLDSTRAWLNHNKIRVFQFCGCNRCRHDIGFARYFLPGAAHNEYWEDSQVFEHFVTDVIRGRSEQATRPGNRKGIQFFSTLLPYLGSFLLLILGVFVLFKATYGYTHPAFDPLQRFVRYRELGIKPPDEIRGWEILRTVFGCSALIAGATLLARLPRLAVGKRWKIAGLLALLAGSVLYVFAVPGEVRNEIGGIISTQYFHIATEGAWNSTLVILLIAAVAGTAGYISMLPRRAENTAGFLCWFRRGMRPLIFCGAIAIGGIVISQVVPKRIQEVPMNGTSIRLTDRQSELVQHTRLTLGELQQIISARSADWEGFVRGVEPVLATSSPIWPVAIAGGGFLYLWWLSTLLFDLSFVWHRYIRNSTANNRLREWNPHGFSPRIDNTKGEECCNPDMLSSTPI